MEKKIGKFEDKFETNMKSVWNVISMTEAVVFDHLKNEKTQSKEDKRSDKTPIQLELQR